MERNFIGLERGFGYGAENDYEMRLREELRLSEELRLREEWRMRMLGGINPLAYGQRFAPLGQPNITPGMNPFVGGFNGQVGNFASGIGYGMPQFGTTGPGGYPTPFGQGGGDVTQQQNAEFYAAQGGTSIPLQVIEPWSLNGPFVGVGPRNYKRSDETVKDEINSRLTQHGQLDASDIEVKVATGEVTLSGAVHSRYEKRLVEDVVEIVAGVKDVHNQLHIRKPIPQQTQQQQQGNRVGEPLLSR